MHVTRPSFVPRHACIKVNFPSCSDAVSFYHTTSQIHPHKNCHQPSTMLPPPSPPHFNIPAFSYRSPLGSYGVEPLSSTVSTVSATSPQGGYPDTNNTMRDLTDTQIQNTLRLLAVVWGSNNQEIILGLFGGPLDSKMAACPSNLLCAFSASFPHSCLIATLAARRSTRSKSLLLTLSISVSAA